MAFDVVIWCEQLILSSAERGPAVPSLTTLIRLAVAHNCRVSGLVAAFVERVNLRRFVKA